MTKIMITLTLLLAICFAGGEVHAYRNTKTHAKKIHPVKKHKTKKIVQSNFKKHNKKYNYKKAHFKKDF